VAYPQTLVFPDSPFRLYQPFAPAGDQPEAIDKLMEGIGDGLMYQTLLGVTGSGKTFTMANVIARLGRHHHRAQQDARRPARNRQFFRTTQSTARVPLLPGICAFARAVYREGFQHQQASADAPVCRKSLLGARTP
jgi:hypothetical protein